MTGITRILLLDTGKEWGGGTNSMFELLRRIDRESFDITALFYRNYRKGDASDLKAELAAIGIPFEIEPPLRQPEWAKLAKELVRGLFFAFPDAKKRLLYRIEYHWRILPTARKLATRLSCGGFNLLYMNNQPSSNLEGYLAAELAGVPVVQHSRSNASLTRAETTIVNRIAARIVCVSQGVRDLLVAQGVKPDLCTVVNNAIDVRQTCPAAVAIPEIPAGKIVIGAVGSLLPRKANDHILRALVLLATDGNCPAHLVLVGDGPERGRLSRLIAELGLEASVTLAGFRPNALAWEAAMDIVVLASDNEGFPRVVLEAMLLAKPVIASNVIGSRELVAHGETGLLYPFGDISHLAEHLRLLIDNPELRRQMGEAGKRTVVAQHSIEHYVSAVEAQLREALA